MSCVEKKGFPPNRGALGVSLLEFAFQLIQFQAKLRYLSDMRLQKWRFLQGHSAAGVSQLKGRGSVYRCTHSTQLPTLPVNLNSRYCRQFSTETSTCLRGWERDQNPTQSITQRSERLIDLCLLKQDSLTAWERVRESLSIFPQRGDKTVDKYIFCSVHFRVVLGNMKGGAG